MKQIIFTFVFSCFIPFIFPEWFYVLLFLVGVVLGLVRIYFSKMISVKSFWILTALFLLPIPSILIDPTTQSLYAYAFFVIPFLPWLLIEFRENVIEAYVSAFKVGVLITVAGIFIQIFIDPYLFGWAKHAVYTGDLYATSSFRPTGFAGSPQNIALILGVGLFFVYSRMWFLDFILKLIIIWAGAQTLATFFGGALILYFFYKARWIAVFAVTILVFCTWNLNLSNTVFEFMMFQELQAVKDRFDLSFVFQDLLRWLFGNGVGSATQGMLDRDLVFFHSYQSESFFLSLLFEFGIIPVFFCVISYCLFGVIKMVPRHLLFTDKSQLHFLLIYMVVLASIALTPTLSSFRMKFLFFPILLMPIFIGDRSSVGLTIFKISNILSMSKSKSEYSPVSKALL
jgi:hypothetical protein